MYCMIYLCMIALNAIFFMISVRLGAPPGQMAGRRQGHPSPPHQHHPGNPTQADRLWGEPRPAHGHREGHGRAAGAADCQREMGGEGQDMPSCQVSTP